MTDTSEQGLESLIVAALVGPAPEPSGAAHDAARSYGAGYVLGQSQDYDADHALDLAKLWAFLKNSDRQNARIEHDSALRRVLSALLKDHTELYKQFMDNPDFRRWLSDTDFAATYAPPQPDQP